jgi:hypothetical protein
MRDPRDKTADEFGKIAPKVLENSWNHFDAFYRVCSEGHGSLVEMY